MEIRPVKELRRDRIEERLGAFGLPVLGEQADEAPLDLGPERVVACEPEVALDALDGFGDAPVVVVDALARDVADREPLPGLEVPLGRSRALAKDGVMPVEAFE